ncbi:hypothetical protein APICC_02548 [Apis cerana cerana]|uniref:Uncharacterized protein n=1 Tax=Apis cerana cerana TaxID=94128 RepID=A0A2A3EH14_APICC|nr:hypothetical protein APICC_02548 [Apis cerana cerana]
MEGKALVVLELSASGSKRLPVSLYGSLIGASYVITSNFHRDEIRVPKQLKKVLVDHRSLLHRSTYKVFYKTFIT